MKFLHTDYNDDDDGDYNLKNDNPRDIIILRKFQTS